MAGCYLLSEVNLYQAQNSTPPRVAGLRVSTVTSLIEFLSFFEFLIKPKLTHLFPSNRHFYLYTFIK